jgi:hypothetical protein
MPTLCLYSSNFGTFWLKIEKFWPFEEISIFSNGVNLGYKTALTDTILKGDHPRIISAEFGIRKKGGLNLKKILSSETTEPISTKLC